MSRRSGRGRLAVTLIVVFAVVAVFVIRLVDIQVVQAASLDAESYGKRSIESVTYGARGNIYDANGVVLAASVMRYDITASPRFVASFDRTVDGKDKTISVDEAAAELAAITGQTAEAVIAAVTADPSADFAYVTKTVDADILAKVKALNIPWIYFENHPSRTYPNGAVAGNLLGFVGSDNEAQAGLELADDQCLAGSNGSETYERGADGVRIPGSTVTGVTAKTGSDLITTIDSDLQWFVQQSLAKQAQAVGASWGTVVVQEVKTGKLLAVADWPTVDPNNVDATAETDVSSLGSRAFTAPFEPGSTFKTLTAASLLDAGLASPDTEVTVPYRFTTADGADVNDSEYHGVEHLTMTGVLKESSNTGMSQLGLLMNADQRYSYMRKFGLGQATEVNFGAEATGDLGGNGTTPEWDAQSNLATMFGQGLTTTAVQMASIYQTIGNGGVRMPVSLVSGCRSADGTVTDVPSTEGTRVVSESAARTTVDMLENVATKGWLANQISIPGYRLATKTGTAQQPDGHGGYTKSYLVSLAGLAPAEDPQYVVSVSLSNPVNMNTSGAAAPIFREVMTQVLKEFRVVPSGSTSPDLATDW